MMAVAGLRAGTSEKYDVRNVDDLRRYPLLHSTASLDGVLSTAGDDPPPVRGAMYEDSQRSWPAVQGDGSR